MTDRQEFFDREYFVPLSGLTPPEMYSLADHQDAYYRVQAPSAPVYSSKADRAFLTEGTVSGKTPIGAYSFADHLEVTP